MGLETHLRLEAGAAVGTDMIGLRLMIRISVDESFVSSPADLSVEISSASGVATPVIHDPRPPVTTRENQKNFSTKAGKFSHYLYV